MAPQFDPALVDLFCAQAPTLFDDLDAATHWDTVIAAEPTLAPVISDEQFEDVLEAIADFVDLKSPYTIGHSRGVADLAAAGRAGLRAAGRRGDACSPGRASCMTSVASGSRTPSGTSAGALTQAEMERVRLHPYLSERMLAFSPALAPLGAIAAQHHERLDGSGYPRGLSGDAITPAGRLLAAADVYHAMTRRGHTGRPAP